VTTGQPSFWRRFAPGSNPWAEGALVALILMELVLVAAWYEPVMDWKTSWPVLFGVLGGVMLATHVLTRTLLALRWNRRVRVPVVALLLVGWPLAGLIAGLGLRLAFGWVALLVFAGVALAMYQRRKVVGQRFSFTPQTVILTIWFVLALAITTRYLVYPQLQGSLVDFLLNPLAAMREASPNLRAFAHLLLVAVLLWRVIFLSETDLPYQAVRTSFNTGLVLLTLYGFMFFIVAPLFPIEEGFHRSLNLREFVLLVYAFAFFSLIALPMARIANVGPLSGRRAPHFKLGWWTTVLGSSLVIVLLGALGGVLFSGGTARLFRRAVLSLLSGVAYVIAIILAPLGPRMADTLRRLAERAQQTEIEPNEPEDFFGNPYQNRPEAPGWWLALTQFLYQYGGYILLGLILAVAIYFIIRIRIEAMEERERGDVRVDEAGRDPNEIERRRVLFPGLRNPLQRAGQLLAAARIRQVYAHLLAQSARLGSPRKAAVTPLEYLPQLEELYVEHAADTRLITQAYLKIRYGELPETEAEVQAVLRAWERVRGEGRRMELQRRLRLERHG
jgi:hypothetical protein